MCDDLAAPHIRMQYVLCGSKSVLYRIFSVLTGKECFIWFNVYVVFATFYLYKQYVPSKLIYKDSMISCSRYHGKY